jgi:xylulokinase
MQIKADIMNREISVLETSEAGTAALALLSAHAVGDIGDIASSAKAAAKRSAVFKPDPERARVYARNMQRYRRAYSAIRSIYKG